tara:strand:+ start:1728 stop:2117 length:390 start_codon:yes stop_codon:yes gene_type:complete
MSFHFPDHFRFADTHEYAFVEGDLIKIGITAFAVDQLGDIVFVELPEVGSLLTKDQSFGSVESVKAVEDMHSPLSGEVVHRNDPILDNPEDLQNDPHGKGWLLSLRPTNSSELEELMDSATYASKIADK